jgi:predicted metal-dependent phosphoesterase TrpH
VRRGRARARLELEVALEDEAERLQAAKEAHTTDPTDETRQARRVEMESLAETRTWLRAVDAIRKAEQEITRLAARGAPADEIRQHEQEIARIRAQHGTLLDAMAQLSTTAAAAAPDGLAPGSVEATPKVVRGRARFGKDGA